MTAETVPAGGGSERRECRTGRTKAPVLPDPVSARPMTSLPWRAGLTASLWMRVAVAQPSEAAAVQRAGQTPREAKVAPEIT